MARESPPERLPFPLGIFREFARLEASGSILLLVCAIVAFAWANSPWSATYAELWETDIRIGAETFNLSESLLHWINDGLMAVFFFVVGLEIKRELLAGELASPRKAALPMVAALGGMLVPAAVYAALNAGEPTEAGWGIPMATDIAFALAIMTALGNRVPTSLKVFLTALAIVDDLGAILVIAVFYSRGVAWEWLAVAAGFLTLLAFFNGLHVRRPLLYALPGIVVWFAFFESGVHATVAGVLVAMTVPARRRIDSREFLARAEFHVAEFAEASSFESRRLMSTGQQEAIHHLEAACEEVETPLTRMEHELLPWVTYLVLPLFALANAGVTVGGDGAALWAGPLTLGIVLGLVLGKQIGITLFAWLAVRLGLAALPSGVRWFEVYGTAWLGGIGFTMSLFIANLAFEPGGPFLGSAKLAILVASVLACAGGTAVLLATPRHPEEPRADLPTVV